MQATALNVIAQSSAERLVNSFFEGAVLAALVWLLLKLIPRQNASTRFSLWMAALLSIATLPLAEGLARIDRPITSAVSHAALTVPAGWGTALFAAWVAIALLLLTRVAVGIVQLIRLRNSADEVELASIDTQSRQTLADFQRQRRTALCVSDRVSVPTAVGLFRPAVVLPPWALSELSATDLNSVLVHELAHLRRRDDWTNLLQKLVRAVFFFHPAVWWIEGRLSLEREMACDEHVLAGTEDPRAYAECLVSLAEKGFLRRAAMLAQGAVHRVKECSARVTQILTSGRPRTAGASRVDFVERRFGFGAAAGDIRASAKFDCLQLAGSGNAIAHNRVQPSEGLVTPAAWHASSQTAPVVTPALYVERHATLKQLGKPATSIRKSVARREVQRQSSAWRPAIPLPLCIAPALRSRRRTPCRLRS